MALELSWEMFGDWSELVQDPREFRFSAKTPMADLRVSVAIALLFVGFILVLKKLRQNKEPMKLELFGHVHNFILFAWSLVMHVGIVWGVLDRVAETNSAFKLLCDDDAHAMRGVLGYFCWMYYLSKYYEYLDTVIIVLRNKPLTVLHFWHHAVIGPMSLSWILGNWTIHWYGACVNTLVHVFMYFYYFVKGVVPSYDPWWRRYITQGQILQFFSVFVLIWIFCYFYVLSAPQLVPRSDSLLPALEFERGCQGDPWVVAFAQFVNITFLVLFINFYIQTYTKKPKKVTDKAKAPKTE